MNERYKIYTGSQSSHCCFEATVVDTTKPHVFGNEHFKDRSGQYHYEHVCECFEMAGAELICTALNARQKTLDNSPEKG